MYKKLALAGVSFVLFLWSGQAARADLIITQAVDITPQGDFAFSFNGEVQTPTTGLMHWKTFPGGQDLGTLFGFCLELLQATPFSPAPYDIVPLKDAGVPNDGLNGPGTTGPIGSVKADLLSELWGRHFAKVVDGLSASAFQGAVWEIAYDADLNLLAGAFQAAIPAQPSVALAQSWLDSLDGTGPRANVVGGTSPDHQDFITELVPEPSTFLLGALGIGTLALSARRLRRRPR